MLNAQLGPGEMRTPAPSSGRDAGSGLMAVQGAYTTSTFRDLPCPIDKILTSSENIPAGNHR